MVYVTVIIDDAGSGDLLFGVVIGAYRSENHDFRYDMIDVQYFQSPKFSRKEYLEQASEVIMSLLRKLSLSDNEEIKICRSYIFDSAFENLIQLYGTDRVHRIKVTGEPQHYTETAYLDEIRNLGYDPFENREEKRARSFFHMMRWLSRNPDMLKYAKTGWPRLLRYRLFRSLPRSVE